MDCSSPGPSVHGICQARVPESVAIAFSEVAVVEANIYFWFIERLYAKAFDCVDHNKLWKILKEMGSYIWLSATPRLLCSWDFSGKKTGVGCHFLLQGIFLTQGSNPSLLYWQADSLSLSPQGRPIQNLSQNITICVESFSRHTSFPSFLPSSFLSSFLPCLPLFSFPFLFWAQF